MRKGRSTGELQFETAWPLSAPTQSSIVVPE